MSELTQAANLPQLTARIQLRKQSLQENILGIGHDLIEARKLVPYGQWDEYLKHEVSFTRATASKLMKCWERFGSNVAAPQHFEMAKMFELLALPSGEEEEFINAKAEEGTPVEDMTQKKLREEIKAWKERVVKLDEEYQKELEQKDKDHAAELDELNEQLADLEQELKDRPTVKPDDYDETKEALVEAKVALEWAKDAAERQAEDFQKQLGDADEKLEKAKKTITKLKKAAERRERKDYTPPTELPQDDFKLIRADIREGLPDIADNSVDFIITDPPYPKEYLPLYEDLSKVAARVLKDGGSLICMTGQSYLPDVINLLATKMTYHWSMCYLTPGQKTQLWQRHLHTSWKPLLWFVKGEYKGDWIGDDVTTSPTNDKQFHEWGQSFGGMKDVIERLTYPNALILDPFLGGGTTGVVVLYCKRKFIGVDIEQSCIDTTLARLKEIFNGTSDT